MLGRVLGAALCVMFMSCMPATSSSGSSLIYSMPNMENMTCYSAPENELVMACTEGDELIQDPALINLVFETILSFFPTVEPPEGLKVVVIYQPYKVFEDRLFERIPGFNELEGGYYVHAHTYFDPDEGAIVIECASPMGLQTLIHEILHHVFIQIAEEEVLDHMILDRTANLILESDRMKDALRENP